MTAKLSKAKSGKRSARANHSPRKENIEESTEKKGRNLANGQNKENNDHSNGENDESSSKHAAIMAKAA